MMLAGDYLCVPAPFVDESLYSFFQRVCARHSFKMESFRRALGIYGSDLDLAVTERMWHRIVGQLGFEREWWLDRMRFPARGWQCPLREREFRAALEVKTYAWCPDCCAEDKEPYFRWYWRFGHGWCGVHGTKLHRDCPACGKAPKLSQTVHVRALNLAHCQHCGVWLGSARTTSQRRVDSSWVAIEAPLQRTGSGGRDHLSRCSRQPTPLNGPALAASAPRLLPLELDWRQFVWPDRMLAHRRKWSEMVARGSPQRGRVAAALRLVRAEVRQLRAAGHWRDGYGSRP